MLRTNGNRIESTFKIPFMLSLSKHSAPFLSTLLFVSLLPFLVGAQDKLRIAYAGGGSTAPVWIIQERDLLKKYNISAEIIQINASPAALQAIVAGDIDLNVTGVTNLVNARLAGIDVVMLMAVMPTFPNQLVAQKSINSVHELKGKIGGINRFGASTDLGVRLVLRRFGLDPENDVKLISVGGTAQAVAAMSKGLIQFGISTEPFVREAEKVGFKTLLDIGALKIPFHWAGVLVRESTIKARRPVFARFVRAMTEAIHIYKTEKEWTKGVIGKYLRTNDAENLERSYNSFRSLFPEVPHPTVDGVKTLLDDLAGKNPKAARSIRKSWSTVVSSTRWNGRGLSSSFIGNRHR